MADAVAAQADIVIAGGGPAGATLALALREGRRSVCVVEPRTAGAAGAASAIEGRALALSHGSRLILERIGVWGALETVTPITEIHISQRGGIAGARITAQESGVPALGYMIGYGALSQALDTALTAAEQASAGRLQVLRGHALDAVQSTAGTGLAQLALQLTPPHPLAARLLAVADGGAGPKLAETHERDYGQSALSCLVASEAPHRNRAYEHFTPAGPLALLPHPRGWSLVWVTPPAETERLLALDAQTFSRELGAAFGPALGAFTLLGERRSFPLRLRYARTPDTPRTVLVGAAAQTLHPVAGQGLNLGLRDAWELARTLIVHAEGDPGAETMLAHYRRRRRRDRFATSAFTDTLIRLFCNDIPGLTAGRGLGLALFDSLPPLKRFVARRMMFGAHGG